MQSARNTEPREPANGVTAGIDWARDDHAVSVVDVRGREISRRTIEHSAGLRELAAVLARAGAGVTVVVISPNQVKNLRGRYGSAGNKDDRFDAYVLADTLRNAFPGAAGLFAGIDSPVSLAFLARFDTQDRADWLTPARMGKWLASIGYSGHTDPAELHARPAAAPRGITGHDADCRARFPTPESLACLAGAAPSTRQSGKMRAVSFRWACDKQLRDAVTDFAGDSRRASPRAADLYDRARARGHDHDHAVRILARAWLLVIWHCWQDATAYDPARHIALQTLLNQDQQVVA